METRVAVMSIIVEDGSAVETINAVSYCEDCDSDYPTVEFGKTCPHCGSGNTWLQQGNEMNIKEIEAC